MTEVLIGSGFTEATLDLRYEHIEAIDSGGNLLTNLFPDASEATAKELELLFRRVYKADPNFFADKFALGILSDADVKPDEIGMPFGDRLSQADFSLSLPRNVRWLERPAENGITLGFMVGVVEDEENPSLIVGNSTYWASPETANYVLARSYVNRQMPEDSLA